MSVLVVITPSRFGAFKFFPETISVSGGGLLYRIYAASAMAGRQEYRDDLDGELLVETRCFLTRRDAERWIAEDVERREAAA